jgi:hypothetical protein
METNNQIETLTYGGVAHKVTNTFNFQGKLHLQKKHPLGIVYVMTQYNPRYGYVANGYNWLRFPISELKNIIKNSK